ncbi:MAG: hypothetical protein M3380_21945 [Chloroflexota bacterium]|nr:hypothetical protein [Chloroflexota bacterium]
MAHEKPSKGKIVVWGIMAWYPLAGVVYQFLHYLNGLRRLGYDPYYIEDSMRDVYDPRINDYTPDARDNLKELVPILQAYGYGDRWAFRGLYPKGECFGMTEAQLLQLYREADACLNITGGQEIREEHRACPRHIYVETDPVASQVKVVQGNERTIARLAAHDTHFSFGENLGALDCSVPVERFHWLPTRQPVDMDLWANPYGAQGTVYNTIATWSNKGREITYQGETYYWRKDLEFKKFLDLPRRSAVSFEIAAGVSKDVERLLRDHGWRQIDSLRISRDVDRYRTYIQCSRGEFTVAKDQNIRLRSGWFSDRSACYLAAGRPVINQETGFSKFLPTGKGVFSFTTIEDILAAVDEIESDYEGNCRAAREIAVEYFAAEKVVGSLMERAGL